MTGSGTELLAEIVEERTRLLSENERLRERVTELVARVTELEAEIATIRGTLSRPDEPDDQPAIIHHDVPPNAPR